VPVVPNLIFWLLSNLLLATLKSNFSDKYHNRQFFCYTLRYTLRSNFCDKYHNGHIFLHFEMRGEAPAMPRSTSQAILSSLPERLSAQLIAGAKSCHLRAGDALFAAGDSGDGCYRLERGLLKVIITSPRGEERILAILGPGEIAGELSIIDRQPRSASVIAVKDCKLSFISQKHFEICAKQDPDIYRYLVNVLALRLLETDKAVAADSFLSVKARLARAFLELAEYLGEDTGAGRVLIRHKISQSDLAAMGPGSRAKT
jgi:CRP/FNR family transcriptional regulator, cyclic AMP receptor protein